MHPMTDADRDTMMVPPDDDSAADEHTGCRAQRSLEARGDARRLRGAGRCGHGVGRAHGDCRKHQGRDHGEHKKDMGKFPRFHKHDPPLTVEIIVEAQSNRLMTRL